MHGGNLACVCSLRPVGTPTHSSLLAQPEPLREQAPAGGGWRGLCCDHNRSCGRWQSVSIIGTSAAAYIGRRSVQKPEANIPRHDCQLPCCLHRSFSDFHFPWCGAACWACVQAKVALKVKDTSPVFRQWDTQKSPAELPASTWSSTHPSWSP